MYAGVPCYHLKKLHEAIAHDMPEPKSAWGTWLYAGIAWILVQARNDTLWNVAARGDCMNRVPGAGGSFGGPAKHCAMVIQRLAVAPCAIKAVSETFRV